jgi:hypothetical protein
LLKGGRKARHLHTGHIIYRTSDNLLAVPFDMEKLEVTGGGVAVLEGIGGAEISDSGTLVYVPGPAAVTNAASAASFGGSLVWVDRQGNEESLGAEPDAYFSPKISPDGAKVAFCIEGISNIDIWL